MSENNNNKVVQVGDVKVLYIEYHGQPVLTTEQLAECYETTAKSIQKNFQNNVKKFVEGKHYFKLAGKELEEFKINLGENFSGGLKSVTVLYLWTKRGVVRHCKSCRSNKAWDAFEVLEDAYFAPHTVLLNTEEILKSLKLALESKAQIEARAKADQRFLKEFDRVLGLNSRRMLETKRNTGVTAREIKSEVDEKLGRAVPISKLVNRARKLGYSFLTGITGRWTDLVLKNGEALKDECVQKLIEVL